MTEEMLLEKLKKIEDISVRREAKEIYQSVFAQINQYQNQTLKELEEMIYRSMCAKKPDYGIDMFVVTQKEMNLWLDICDMVDCTCEYTWCWEEELIKRVYMAVNNEVLTQIMKTERLFNATIGTNLDTYRCRVALRAGGSGITFVELINELLSNNCIDMPSVSDAYAKRFFDVVYVVQNDRLRKGEIIESIWIDWEELTPYVNEDAVLLCNVRKRTVKEQIFPFFERNELRYKHEISLLKKEYGYLIDVSELMDYEIQRVDEKCWIKTTQKEYKEWELYEIVPRAYWETYGNADMVLSNRVKESILTNIQRKRICTNAEIYRMILGYSMAEYFDKIELNGEEILFEVKRDRYMLQDFVDFIVQDMKELHPNIEFKGIILKGNRES